MANNKDQIQTGTLLATEAMHNDSNQDAPRITNGNALLPSNTTDTVSRDFSVTHVPVRIIAYGLFGGGVIHVMRVLPPNSTTNTNVCGGISSPGITHEKPYRIGCEAVLLCPGQDEIVIDAVGTYRLHYVGDSRQMVHVVKQDEPLSVITNNLRGTEVCCHVQDSI